MNDACRLTTLKVLNVLIDTWWNVNFAYYRFIDAVLTVLIDTWWNVNQLAEGGVLKKGQGFNRYMVECEC